MADVSVVKKEVVFDFPIGYNKNFNLESNTVKKCDEKINKRSWSISLEPIQGLPINAFMLWMSGNKLSFFPIMLILMNIFRHIKAIINIKSTYDSLEGDYRYLQLVVFFLGHCVGISLILYKCFSIGLLRLGKNEWSSYSHSLKQYDMVFHTIYL
ncbi:hypothetical protein HZS_6051 [Henneguya salminicola]|nr:hypothetical protein HZS_6051 [Henneguya salminicola]